MVSYLTGHSTVDTDHMKGFQKPNMHAATLQKWASGAAAIPSKRTSGTSKPPTKETREQDSGLPLSKPQHLVKPRLQPATRPSSKKEERMGRMIIAWLCRRSVPLFGFGYYELHCQLSRLFCFFQDALSAMFCLISSVFSFLFQCD